MEIPNQRPDAVHRVTAHGRGNRSARLVLWPVVWPSRLRPRPPIIGVQMHRMRRRWGPRPGASAKAP